MESVREPLREAHRRYLKSQGRRLIASGAVLADDGVTVIGGMSILDTESRQEAEEFAACDPYAHAGIRKTTQIQRWRRRWIDGEFIEAKPV